MPQMSPLMWGVLFIMFSCLMVLTAIKIFYTYINELKPSTNNTSPMSSTMVWTW